MTNAAFVKRTSWKVFRTNIQLHIAKLLL